MRDQAVRGFASSVLRTSVPAATTTLGPVRLYSAAQIQALNRQAKARQSAGKSYCL